MSIDVSREHPRAETARRNDDSDLVEQSGQDSLPGAGQQGSEGGNLQRDLGTQAEAERSTDPEATESITKGDHVAHGQGSRPPQPAEEAVTERD